MIFQKKNAIDQHVKDYENTFCEFVDSTKDVNQLNKIFTEITILRIKLDKNDRWSTNYKDEKERRDNCTREKLIKIQFNDIMKISSHKYNQEDYELIDSAMKSILPQGNQTNWWEEFWRIVCESFDKATGRKS